MKAKQFSFEYEEYNSENQLLEKDKYVLQKAREAIQNAYAPYSHFLVGAAALLSNNEVVTGSNQESASFPSCICAERALLASAAQLYPNIAIVAMAVTYKNLNGNSEKPATPCGFCRQVMAEYEQRMETPMRLILAGTTGAVFIFPSTSMLLPLAFQLTASE